MVEGGQATQASNTGKQHRQATGKQHGASGYAINTLLTDGIAVVQRVSTLRGRLSAGSSLKAFGGVRDHGIQLTHDSLTSFGVDSFRSYINRRCNAVTVPGDVFGVVCPASETK